MDAKLVAQSHWHPAMRPDSDISHDERTAQPHSESEEKTARGNSDASLQLPPALSNGLNLPEPPLGDFTSLHDTGSSSIREDLTPHSVEDAPFASNPYAGDHEGKVAQSQEHSEHMKPPQRSLDTASSTQQRSVGDRNIEHAFTKVQELRSSGSTPADEHVPAWQVTEPENIRDAIGGKEEMDIFWRTEKDNASFGHATGLNRTNSFPEVPPLRESTALPPQALPKSQAEDIMEEVEDADEAEAFGNVISHEKAQESLPQDLFASVTSDDDFGFSITTSAPQPSAISPSPVDEDARYEEGLPLVPPMSASEDAAPDYRVLGNFNAESPGAKRDEGGFERTVNSPEGSSSSKPRPLDRKSTSQVLDSMHYAAHNVTHTAPDTKEDRPSLANMTGGGIASSTSTVESQVFADHQEKMDEPRAKDEDLAEMWKAALGEDDLLEDNEISLDPSAFFKDDGEGFLEEENQYVEGAEDRPLSAYSPMLEPVYGLNGTMQGFGKADSRPAPAHNKYMPTSASQAQQQSPSVFHQSQFSAGPVPQIPQAATGLSHSTSTPTGFADAARQQQYSANGGSVSRPQMPVSTQSFADKSKGGYTSPYDLPMDVTRPKKRTHFQQTRPSSESQNAAVRPPPPRSSSMFTGAPSPSESHPPVPAPPQSGANGAANSTTPSMLKTMSSTSSFFEELPSSKPRPSSSMGRFLPPISQPTPPPPTSSNQHDSTVRPRADQASFQTVNQTSQIYQLLPPERVSLYGNTPQQQSVNHTIPAMNARYSPAPAQQSSVPPPLNRYASSPSSGPRPPPSQSLPFQPRTSSPLAQNHAVPQQPGSDPTHGRPSSSGRQGPKVSEIFPPGAPLLDHQGQYRTGSRTDQTDRTASVQANSQIRETSPPLQSSRYAPLSTSPSILSHQINSAGPDRLSSDGLVNHQQVEEPAMSRLSSMQTTAWPRRSQTQSPGAGNPYQDLPLNEQITSQRPASVNDHKYTVSPQHLDSATARQTERRRRGFSQSLNYVRPSDGREMDPLERWRGCPIVSFGFGGTVVTTFPKQIPRYAAGQKIPMMKCSQGEVKLQQSKSLTLDENIASFPGPLKSKGKKKEILDWLQNRVHELEKSDIPNAHIGLLPDPVKCREERVLLWKIVKVLVEFDGAVDGSPQADQAVRAILSPELTQGDAAPIPRDNVNAPLIGISRRSGSHSVPHAGNPGALEELRKTLLQGDREKAVWYAVDNRLWAHAMLLSSTLDKSVWKQVSQEFVRQEVKTFGENTESLSALYQIFAGNWEESVDELVPPSARAGLQMVSKNASTGPIRNALDGLDRWRETLNLILSNRTSDDGKALVSLGQLLASYGRTEAAHICYIFAKSPGLFGGPDDQQVSVALLGADHLRNPFDYGRDFDNILLTEVYDFARTVLASSSVATVSPHLQSYKLYHAMVLAEYGYKPEAQQYCDAITSALKSTTKPSPYYHGLLFGALENLGERLRQTPRDSSGSWISKPSIDKVSGSIWAKFNSYVAGDESDAASTGSGKPHDPDAGPFAKIAGDSPVLSRTPSSNDLYDSYSSGLGLASSAPTANSTNSRYAPAGLYTPRSSLDQAGRSSQDFKRPAANDTLRPSYAPQQYSPRPTSSNGSFNEPYKPASQPSSYPHGTESYLPTPPSQPGYIPEAPIEEVSSPLYQQEPYQPTSRLESPPAREQFQPNLGPMLNNAYEPPSSGYAPSPTMYEPPSNSSYEPPSYDPPSYDPDIPQAESSPSEERLQKKSIMDDDGDDFEGRAVASRKEEKARKDREADEAFRKAAEADGKSSKA